MRYFHAFCLKCFDVWYQPCWVEFNFVTPEDDHCKECGGDIEVDPDDEWEPGQDIEREREVPFDL